MACCCVLRDGGKNSPAPSDGHQEKHRAGEQQQRMLPRNGMWKTSSATVVISTTSSMPTSANGQRLAEHQLQRADGRHHQLLHGADLFLAHDGQRRQHQGHDHDDVGDHARHEVVAAVQVGIEPHARPRIDLRHLHVRRRVRAARQYAHVLLAQKHVLRKHGDDLGRIARHQRGRIRVGAVDQHLHFGGPRPQHVALECGQHAHHRLRVAAVQDVLHVRLGVAPPRPHRSAPIPRSARAGRGSTASGPCPSRRCAVWSTSRFTAKPKISSWTMGGMNSSTRMRGSRSAWINSFRRMTTIRSHIVHASF